jgi:hypothetical protein
VSGSLLFTIAKAAATEVNSTPLWGVVPTGTRVVIPLSFRIFCRPVSLSPIANLSTNAVTTGSSPFGATAGI